MILEGIELNTTHIQYLTALPPELTTSVGAGRWLITIQPAPTPSSLPMRNHSAFLNSYVPEDEGLYDDYTR